jgi:predicted transcriptional regulator
MLERMSATTTEYVGAYVPPELRAGLGELARRNERTVSAELRRAIAAHLEREQAEAQPTTEVKPWKT